MPVQGARVGGPLLFRIVRAIGAVENEESRCCGLTLGQALALLTLKPGKCIPMRRVAEELGVSAGTATRVVDNLVRDGLARRGNDPADRRRVCGRPTIKGEARIRDLEKCYETFWDRVFSGLPGSRVPQALETLKFLAASADRVRSECCGRPGRRRAAETVKEAGR